MQIPKDFGYWLSGFVDGEGCFQIKCDPRKTVFSCVFSIQLRADDKAILKRCQRITGLGNLYEYPGRGNSKPTVIWSIQSKDDCLKFVRLLDKFPLQTKKSRDFKVWRKGVLEWTNFTPRVKAQSWLKLASLSNELRSTRAFI